jgi:hypothetical protein
MARAEPNAEHAAAAPAVENLVHADAPIGAAALSPAAVLAAALDFQVAAYVPDHVCLHLRHMLEMLSEESSPFVDFRAPVVRADPGGTLT